MNSIGARLTLVYANCAMASLALLCILGYGLQKRQLVHGLDLLVDTEFQQVKARLGAGYEKLDSNSIRLRVREATEYSSALFYIFIENPRSGVSFSSVNLRGDAIPDVRGRRSYNAVLPHVGEVRVNEFLLPPLDVTIATPARPVTESLRVYVRVCLALLAVMLLMSVGLGYWLSRLVTSPIRQIQRTAARIGSNNLGERVPVGRVSDEFSDLARLLNAMFDRLQVAFDQIRRFSDEASHELKTPLSLVRLHAERLLADETLGPVHTEAVLVQLEELARLNQVIDDLLFLSRAEVNAVRMTFSRQSPSVYLATLIPDALALTDHHGLTLKIVNTGERPVILSERWIRQVVLNLLSNAIKASPSGGLIQIEARVVGDLWIVAIEDEGPGAPPEFRQRIFERFVRLENSYAKDRGSGLGLAICKSIVLLHGGRIYARSGKGGGLRVVFEIPLEAPERAAASAWAPAARSPRVVGSE